jgi:membrane-bound lytic murein transglycosylase B
VRRALALIAWVALVPASAAPPAAPAPGFDLKRPEIRDFMDEVSKRDRIRAKTLKTLLGKAVPQPKIIELITRPAEKVVPWWQYRDRFMTEERIAQGAQFWQDNREPLERIAAEHGVPPEYIVAIIGVETFYGRNTGRYRVLDALATLAFDYPPRSEFFRKELEEFVVLSREDKIDPLAVTGSYAGAMGASQFMPSSYRRYALDGDADGKRDLWASWADVFASIANYFREHGWQTGAPVVVEARLEPDPVFQINPKNLELNETLASLNKSGVEVDTPLPPETKAILISAEQRDGPAYRVGFNNFQVITRYNRSVRYAMAVHDLAQTVAFRLHSAPPPPAPAPAPASTSSSN